MARPHLEIDLNVLNHLGIGLYSSTPAVVSEIIANAWDADAENVHITIDAGENSIVIQDDGHGMDAADFQDKFLCVGYARRDQPGGKISPKLKRPVMGRKGIGKLAMFSLANKIDVLSRKKGKDAVGGLVDVGKLKKHIEGKKRTPFELGPCQQQHNFGTGTGTRIVLTELETTVNKTDAYLRPRIARRFSIIAPKFKFQVFIDKRAVTKEDRGFYTDIQFLWHFDDKSKAEVKALAINLAKLDGGAICETRLSDTIRRKSSLKIKGYIATVDKPAKLTSGDANINQLSIFANGRMFQEDVLRELGNSKVFNSYIIGEIHADFLDADKVDRATASREAIKRDDPEFNLLKQKLKDRLKDIEEQWDVWRRELGYAKSGEPNKFVQAWLDSLIDKRDRKLADRLMVSISNLALSNDPEKDRDLKLQLYRSTIVGFEKLKSGKQLQKLEAVLDVTGPEFRAIFASIDEIEASQYHDITKSRLGVIEKFSKIVGTKQLEKVAQRYLFNHLWLLDPTWGRVSGSASAELTLTKELKKVQPSAASGARIDIAYRTSGGRHAIIELKRPGKTSLSIYPLLQQVDKYKKAMTEYLKTHPDFLNLNGRIPPIDVFILVEAYDVPTEQDEKVVGAANVQLLTYSGLINSAQQAYQEYFESMEATSSIERLLKNLG